MEGWLVPETEVQVEEDPPWEEGGEGVGDEVEGREEPAPCWGEVLPCLVVAWCGLSLSPGHAVVEDLLDDLAEGQTHWLLEGEPPWALVPLGHYDGVGDPCAHSPPPRPFPLSFYSSPPPAAAS